MMGWDREHGCATPGTIGRANHHGDPLTVQQIRELPDDAEVVITWDGGNGPHPYRILVDQHGQRRVQIGDADEILKPYLGEQTIPFHRITLGWDDQTRAWHHSKMREPAHIQEKWRRLRGEVQP